MSSSKGTHTKNRAMMAMVITSAMTSSDMIPSETTVDAV
jgi:hypothetical protein